MERYFDTDSIYDFKLTYYRFFATGVAKVSVRYSGVFHLYGESRKSVEGVRDAGKPFAHKTG